MTQALLRIPASEVRRRLAISQRLQVPEWKRARAVELRQEGLTYPVIGERLGLHPRTVLEVLARAGLVPPRVCVCCGRGVRGNPTVSEVAVCGDCKPRWREKMRFRRGT